jgi:gluconate:H+ symporter, GntP family
VDPLLLALFGVALVAGAILLLRLDAFLALILAALVVGALTPRSTIEQQVLARGADASEAARLADQPTGERVARAFGATAGNIGILIAMAAVIGRCLLESGAADRVVRTALRLVGVRLAPIGFSASGFLLSIPVFFDTVFYLMIPLGKAMALRSGARYGLYVMAIAGGGAIAHSLVPPTPGPLFVATALGVDVGQMMLVGGALGLIATVSGWAYAYAIDRRWPVPLRETPDMSLADLRTLADRDLASLPPLWAALLPIVLPVLLIGGNAVVGTWTVVAPGETYEVARRWLAAVGDKQVALTIAAAIALALLVRAGGRTAIATSVPRALMGAGTIILVTSAGGAFGSILQQTGVGDQLRDFAGASQIGILPLAFLATALVRTAQGSATVAMITVVGMVGGLAAPETLGCAPVYLAAAIGFGSKPFAWMNDSGFWVVSRMSGMTTAETLRNFSTMISLMGLTGILTTMAAAALFPLL